MNRQLLAHLALLMVALIYGGNYVVAKIVMEGGFLSPLPFILLRALSATVLFWLVFAVVRPGKVERKDLPRLFLCGLTGIAVNQMFFFTGLNWTSSVNASLIMTMTPILVLVASAFLLGERITLQKLVGIGLGAAGAILLIGYGQEIRFGGQGLWGDLMVLVNATSFGLYLVLVKPMMQKYNALTVMSWIFTFGLMVVIPFGLPGFIRTDWQAFTPGAWWAVAYVILLVTFLVYFLNGMALKEVSPSIVSIYIYLQPLVAGFLSVMLGKEVIDKIEITSTLLIFSGVFLVSGLGKPSRQAISKWVAVRKVSEKRG
jgi:drug/metabolite transporter (DMT)-like permease